MNDDYMISFQNETKQTIEASYKKMTAVERSVADFFIGNKDDMDFSSKNISRVLYVSEATLSRFSQKCGYKGYREFIFSYERDHIIIVHLFSTSSSVPYIFPHITQFPAASWHPDAHLFPCH